MNNLFHAVWCDNFLDSSRKKLAEAYAKACDMMEELQIQVLEAKGAFFLWANLQPFLTEPTVEAEFGEYIVVWVVKNYVPTSVENINIRLFVEVLFIIAIIYTSQKK